MPRRRRASLIGRPTKLTPELQVKICDALRAGNYIETAAAFAGIDRSTVYDWLRRGAQGESRNHVAFYCAVEKAMADAEARDVALIAKAAADGHWQAAAWRLERRYPDRYGRPAQRVIHEGGTTNTNVTIPDAAMSLLTDEELEQLESITSRALARANQTTQEDAT